MPCFFIISFVLERGGVEQWLLDEMGTNVIGKNEVSEIVVYLGVKSGNFQLSNVNQKYLFFNWYRQWIFCCIFDVFNSAMKNPSQILYIVFYDKVLFCTDFLLLNLLLVLRKLYIHVQLLIHYLINNLAILLLKSYANSHIFSSETN